MNKYTENLNEVAFNIFQTVFDLTPKSHFWNEEMQFEIGICRKEDNPPVDIHCLADREMNKTQF